MTTQISKRTVKRATTKTQAAEQAANQAALSATENQQNQTGQSAANTNPEAAFMKDVQSDLAMARATALWQRFKWPFVAGVVLLFVAVGASQWFAAEKVATQKAQASLYFTAQNAEGPEAAAAKAELLENGAPLYQFLLGKADAPLPEAFEAFTQTAQANDVATLRGLDTAENPYQVLAIVRLMHAADAAGDVQAANAYRQRLVQNPKTPSDIRQLAQVQLGLHGVSMQ